MIRPSFIYFLLFIVIFVFVFRSLVTNLPTNLPDWLDYALVNWLITENTQKILSFQFGNFFDTRAFFPHKDTLFFADTFLPQTLLGLPFSIFIKNRILVFNIIFIITFLLNYLSSYLFWKKVFNKDLVAFLGALFIVFSPFLHLHQSHFQMMSYWPFFFTLYFIWRNEEKFSYKNTLLAGFFLALQFLAGIYLSVYLLFTIFVFYLYRILFNKERVYRLKSLGLILGVFILIDGLFIKGYFDMKHAYNIQRDFKEFVNYSAHITDYIFTSQMDSVIHNSWIINKWNSFDKNSLGIRASFPGFLLFILSLLGMFRLLKTKNSFSLTLPLNEQKLFFISLILIGFFFSLGPRLNVNGSYAYIPLPFNAVMKTIPIVEATRVPSRWSFLFYFGVTFFALTFITERYNKKYFTYFIGGVVIIFLLEYIPLSIKTHPEEYINTQYTTLKQYCLNPGEALLEIPVTHLNVYPDIGTGVNYISKVELSTSYHQCNIVNGYSGYDLPQLFALQSSIDGFILKQDVAGFVQELKNNQVTLVKINPSSVVKEEQLPVISFMQKLDQTASVKKIDTNIYKIN